MSTTHVTVREVDAVLALALLATNVLVCVRLQPLVCTLPSVNVTVTSPQASVAVALPNEDAGSTGLHPRLISV